MHGTATKLATARNIKLEGDVSGNVNFDGSANVIITTNLEVLTIITGTIILNPNTGDWDTTTETTTKTISYPTGLNKDNCVVVSIGIKNNYSTSEGYVYGNNDTHDIFILQGGFNPSRVKLKESSIQLDVDNSYNGEISTSYKIVLMKV